MLTEAIGMVSMVLAVAGVWLNNRKLRGCFYLWLVSNSLSAVLHGQAGLWSLLARDVIFLALAVEGIIKWKTIQRGDGHDGV